MSSANNAHDRILTEIIEVKTLVTTFGNVINEKLDKLLKEVQNLKNNSLNPVLSVHDEIQIGKTEQATQSQRSQQLPEHLEPEQLSEVVSEKGPITQLIFNQNESQELETPEPSESGNESGSVWEPSQFSEDQTQSQSLEKVNKKSKWQKDCQKLVKTLWNCKYSKEFRSPVDELIYPDYRSKVSTPMDLLTVKEQLNSGTYKNITEFIKDMDLIFTNSKIYTPDKKLRIYKDTIKLEKKYNQLADRMILKYKKNSPTKRKTIKVIDSDEDNYDSDNASPAKRKRFTIDEAGTSDDNEVESQKKKMNTPSPRKRIISAIPNKRKVVQSYKEESSEISSSCESESEDETASNTETSSNSEEDDEDDSWADLSEAEKERLEKIAQSIPLSTPETVERINLNDMDKITVTGRVIEKEEKETFSRGNQKHVDLLSFVIQINGDKQIYCCAWEQQAHKYRRQIRLNQIICIEKGKVMKETDYNVGNVNFEIGIRDFTRITDKIKDKRLG